MEPHGVRTGPKLHMHNKTLGQHETINRSLRYLVTEEIGEQHIVYGQIDGRMKGYRISSTGLWPVELKTLPVFFVNFQHKCNSLHSTTNVENFNIIHFSSAFYVKLFVNLPCESPFSIIGLNSTSSNEDTPDSSSWRYTSARNVIVHFLSVIHWRLSHFTFKVLMS